MGSIDLGKKKKTIFPDLWPVGEEGGGDAAAGEAKRGEERGRRKAAFARLSLLGCGGGGGVGQWGVERSWVFFFSSSHPFLMMMMMAMGDGGGARSGCQGRRERRIGGRSGRPSYGHAGGGGALCRRIAKKRKIPFLPPPFKWGVMEAVDFLKERSSSPPPPYTLWKKP